VKVAEVMTPEFQVVQESTTLLAAMERLRECPLVEDEIGIKCVVVLGADGKLSGILTQSDVVGEILFPYFVRELAAPGQRPAPSMEPSDFRGLAAWAAKVRVRDVMSRDPVTVRPDANIFEAADLIVSRRVKSLPVVRDGRVLGIVYRSSLYHHIAESILDAAPVTGK